MNIKQSCCLVGLCLSMTYMAWAKPMQSTLVDNIVANVDNQIILQSELETAYQQYLSQGGEGEPNLKCKILESLILNKALLVHAKQKGIVVTREEVDQALSRRMQYWVTQAGSEASLAHHFGKSIVAIKNELRKTLQEQLILEKTQAQIIKEVTATPQEVNAFFDALSPQERPYCRAEVVVRQIVQYPKVDQQVTGRLVAQLQALQVRLQNGEHFEDLARAYSQDLGSAPQGGELGFWRLGELAPAYEAAALALQPGEVSEPVETRFGFHLIQLIAREKDRYNSRHILLKTDADKADIGAAKAYLAALRDSILAGKQTFEEAAIASSEDTSTASVGGLLTGGQGGVRMVTDDLPPDVYFAIDQLAPGAISDPIVLSTPDNQKVVSIFLLEERVAPHEANLVQDYAKIQQQLINKKQATALEAWFKEVQANVSIKVAPEYQHCELLK